MPKSVTTAGAGTLSVQRVIGDVRYTFTPGTTNAKAARGSLVGDPEHMRAAFRRGDATLSMDDGRTVPIRVVAHTDGGDTAYFEA